MTTFDLIFLIGLLSLALVFFAYGVPLYFLGRYISKNHPHIWKKLRSPSLTTGQGIRRDRLSEWIGKKGYLSVNDPNLLRWCPILRKLQRFAYTYVVIIGLGILICFIFRRFL